MASSSPMDLGPPPAKSARTDISNKYQTKSEANKAQKNPDKAPPLEEQFYVQPLGRKYDEPKIKKRQSTAFSQIPTLTLRMLMPGDSKEADKDDKRMDLAFKQEKVEFLLVARPVTQQEIKAGYITESVNASTWDIPEIEDFEDCMGQAVNAICKKNIKLIHQVTTSLDNNRYTSYLIQRNAQVQLSSVASQTGIGAFSIKTDDMEAMEELRANIRGLVLGDHCFESFPRDALLKKYGLTIYFPRACAHMDPDLLIEVLRECTPGLKGTSALFITGKTYNQAEHSPLTGQIETIDCKIFKETNANIRRRGVKIISFTGDETFLDSLHSFPANFPFSVKLANCYIRGGDRVKERYGGTKPQRPKMAMNAVRELLRRNSTTITNEALDEEERLANNMRNTNIEGMATQTPKLAGNCCLIILPLRPHRLTGPRPGHDPEHPSHKKTYSKKTLQIRSKPTTIYLIEHTTFMKSNCTYPSRHSNTYHTYTFIPGHVMQNAIEALDLLDINPDLIITTRADLLPPGWDSHVLDDLDIFTDVSTQFLEFVLVQRRDSDAIPSWHAPPEHLVNRVISTVLRTMTDSQGPLFKATYKTDIGLPTITLPAKNEGSLGILRQTIRDTKIDGFAFETVPTRYPLNFGTDRAADIESKSVSLVSKKCLLSRSNLFHPLRQQPHNTGPTAPRPTSRLC